MSLFDDTRADWAARPPTSPLTAVPSSARLGRVWHWNGPALHLFGQPHTKCLEAVRAMQAFHQKIRGWSDHGYNALVCPHARTIEGRGVGVAAAHSPSWNTTRWGIQFMVGQGEQASPAMLARAARLAQDLEALAGHDLDDKCHHDDPKVSTACCGPQLTGWVRAGGPETKPAPPVTTTQEKVMHTLVKLPDQDAVWLSDLITRRWVQTPRELDVVKANLKARGVPATVTVVASLGPYGVPVGKVPA